ncbi:hypothetical protein CCR85_06120 [Rhodothalassium salexigens]|uniref:transporter n=1 Tax=Rhodothalassium salexigens TaxID=1086 RepID=UPI001911B480|nr:transporter [Rhodothalassium salexigens]MBK5911066.1 hypothetical protein [Rhodothalassium salexigens]MBK5920041.1 hypothetical protein [Rhodothalassium salexigens]
MIPRPDPSHAAAASALLRAMVLVGALAGGLALVTGAAAADQAEDAPDRTAGRQALRDRLRALQDQITRQQRDLAEQQAVIEAQAREIDRLIRATATPAERPTDPAAPTAAARRRPAETDRPPTVGERDAAETASESRQTDVAIFADVGGVLTPKGQFVLEPRVDVTQAGVNRFFFQGVEVIDVVLVGLFELTDADRLTYTGSLSGRYGITDRFEIDAEIPYVRRDDRITSEAVSLENTRQVAELSGSGLGDPEIGLHYQLNRGRGGWPVFVANARAKSDFGKGPFEIDRDAEGRERELPVGSGFWTLEPSLTMLATLDPAVLFVNAGYLFNLGKDLSTEIGDVRIDRVDPGDTVRAGFGLGVGLNDRLSFSLGYEHNYVLGTETVFEGVRQKSTGLQVGSLLFGISMGLTDRLRLNLNTQVGVTDDAPDMRVGLTLPFRF